MEPDGNVLPLALLTQLPDHGIASVPEEVDDLFESVRVEGSGQG